MRAAGWRIAAAAALAGLGSGVGCQQILGLEPGEKPPAEQVPPECTEASACPDPAPPCLRATCTDNTCGAEDRPEGENCGGGLVCNGSGACVDGCAVLGICAPGELVFGRLFGDAGDQSIVGIAVDSDDRIVVAGTFQNRLDLGSGALNPPAGRTIGVFVAWLDAQGAVTQSQVFGLDGTFTGRNQGAFWFDVDAEGQAFLVGELSGTLSTPDGDLVGSNNDNLVALVLDKDGAMVASKQARGGRLPRACLGRSQCQRPSLAHGWHNGPIDFGSGPLTSGVAALRRYLAAFDALLANTWSANIDTVDEAMSETPTSALARYGPDGFVVLGDNRGEATIAGTTLMGNGADVTPFVAFIDVQGGALAEPMSYPSVAHEGDGMVLAGPAKPAVVWGFGFGNTLASVAASGMSPWSVDLGRRKPQLAGRVREDGGVVITGSPSGADFGSGNLAGSGSGNDVLLARYDAAGMLIDARAFGDACNQLGRGVAWTQRRHVGGRRGRLHDRLRQGHARKRGRARRLHRQVRPMNPGSPIADGHG